MKAKLIVLLGLVSIANACGTARPDPNDYKTNRSSTGTQAPASGTKSATNTPGATADGSKSTADNKATVPAPAGTPKPNTATPPPPAGVKAPARVIANATELANARTLYASACLGCHMALPTNDIRVKGKTAAQVIAGKAKAPHPTIATYPVDVKTDDGVENEVLAATAMAEALK